MKKRDLHSLMIAGITTGLLLSHQDLKAEADKHLTTSRFLELVASTNGNITFSPMTEDDLLLEVNEEGGNLYKSLSPEGQQLALKLASRACNGENDCKGQNACRTDKNKCAGLGECKGLTKCSFSDKSLAVKVAAKLMAKKRDELQKNASTPLPNSTPNSTSLKPQVPK